MVELGRGQFEGVLQIREELLRLCLVPALAGDDHSNDEAAGRNKGRTRTHNGRHLIRKNIAIG